MIMETLNKTCKRCSKEKPLDLFVKHRVSRHGRGSWCLSCFNTYMKQRIRERQEIIDQHKSKPCVDCQLTFHPVSMDFDHVRGSKLKEVSRLLTYSLERFLGEIAKCEVVCACCHRIRTRAISVSVDPKYLAFQARLLPVKTKPCLDCGSAFPPEAMDFDHVRDLKVRDISQMSLAPWVKVEREIAKCDLVCANCHRLRTQARKEAA